MVGRCVFPVGADYTRWVRILWRTLSTTSNLWPFYLVVALGSLVVTGLGLATPFIIGRATDVLVDYGKVGGNGDDALRQVLMLAGLLLLAQLINAVVQNGVGYVGDMLSVAMRRQLSALYFQKLLGLPQRYYDDESTGKIINRLNRSITELAQFVKFFSNNFLSLLLTIAAVLIVSAYYVWPLAVLLAVIYPSYMAWAALSSRHWQRVEQDKNEELDLASGRFAEVVGQIQAVKSFVRERTELLDFTRRFGKVYELTGVQSRRWHWIDIARQSSLAVLFFGIYATLFWWAVRGRLTIGEMVLLLQLVAIARHPADSMNYIVDMCQRAIAGSKSFFEVMDLKVEGREVSTDDVVNTTTGQSLTITESADRDFTELVDLPSDSAAIEFRNVTFSYDGKRDVIRDVSLKIQRGQRVAMVSESGGGKSTLISLLLGMYEPDSGSILIGGVDVAQMTLAERRRRVAVVFQESMLFSGTIRENIAYGHPAADDVMVQDVAARANVEQFVKVLQDGYDSRIGERGMKLSGGQKQRIAIARAMLKPAPILVLDEATSALDTRSERMVQDGLADLMTDRTSLIIAHRLSTISSVDAIVTLDEGKVSEFGSPQELATSGGIYGELLALQESASAADRKRLKEFGIVG